MPMSPADLHGMWYPTVRLTLYTARRPTQPSIPRCYSVSRPLTVCLYLCTETGASSNMPMSPADLHGMWYDMSNDSDITVATTDTTRLSSVCLCLCISLCYVCVQRPVLVVTCQCLLQTYMACGIRQYDELSSLCPSCTDASTYVLTLLTLHLSAFRSTQPSIPLG